MIVDHNIRKEVEKCGRQEITSSMIARAEYEKDRQYYNMFVEYQKDISEMHLLSPNLLGLQASSQTVGMYRGISRRCPFCSIFGF